MPRLPRWRTASSRRAAGSAKRRSIRRIGGREIRRKSGWGANVATGKNNAPRPASELRMRVRNHIVEAGYDQPNPRNNDAENNGADGDDGEGIHGNQPSSR